MTQELNDFDYIGEALCYDNDLLGYAEYMSRVLELEKEYPNDKELGEQVRKLIKQNEEIQY